MKIVGLMLVRNEDWVLPLSIDIALRWCDDIVVTLHRCTDRTREIVYGWWGRTSGSGENGSNRVHVCEESDEETWDEMDLRQAMLHRGRVVRGTHFAIIDADEVLTHNLLPRIRGMFESLRPGQQLNVPMVPVWSSLSQYRDDNSVWSQAWLTLGFMDAPELHWKAAHDGYQHHARPPKWSTPGIRWPRRGEGGVMHLQFANKTRLRMKHLWYAVTERVRWPNRKTSQQLNAMYGQALDERDMRLSEVPESWWGDYPSQLISLASKDSWHIEDIRRMIQVHGTCILDGLDLRGLDSWVS